MINHYQTAAKALFVAVMPHLRPASAHYPTDTVVYDFNAFCTKDASLKPMYNQLHLRRMAISNTLGHEKSRTLDDETVFKLGLEQDAYWTIMHALSQYACLETHTDISILSECVTSVGADLAQALVLLLSSK